VGDAPAAPRERQVGARLLLGLALAAIGGAWWWLSGPETRPTPEPGPAPDAELRRDLDALRQALEAEIAERERLEEEVGWLASRLAPEVGAPPDAGEAEAPPPAGAGEAAAGAAEAPAGALGLAGGAPFDEAALVGAGVDPERARRLRERWEEHELEKLYLADEALRGGWLRSPRHAEQRRGLEAGLREELGEAEWDQLLYATGQPNRVVVSHVLAGSPAARAGLEAGDVIVAYDGRSVFRRRDLVLGTAAGDPGELVTVRVERSGEPVTVRMPRGPLGVTISAERRSPSP
jgi:hypothetical protein